MNIWGLNNIADAAADPASFCLHPYVRAGGWEASFAERPFGAADIPAPDDMIRGLGRFVLSRAFGMFPAGQEVTVGSYPDGSAVKCAPRGPEWFYAVEAMIPGFIAAARKRTDWCRSKGGESAIYIGLPALTALPRSLTAAARNARVMSWVRPILDAGFSRVQLDASAACASGGPKTAGRYFMEACLAAGLAVDIECAYEKVTPGNYANFDGRFGGVVTLGDYVNRRGDGAAGPGWFTQACPGVISRWFLWLQGSVPVGERTSAAENTPGFTDAIVELGGVSPGWWGGA